MRTCNQARAAGYGCGVIMGTSNVGLIQVARAAWFRSAPIFENRPGAGRFPDLVEKLQAVLADRLVVGVTVTLSKNARVGRSFAIAVMAEAKSSLATAAEASALASRRLGPVLLSAASAASRRRTGVGLLSFFSSCGECWRALGAGQQILAVVVSRNLPSASTRRTIRKKIVLAFKCEHRIDEVVARALFAKLDLEAIGEEGRRFVCSFFSQAEPAQKSLVTGHQVCGIGES